MSSDPSTTDVQGSSELWACVCVRVCVSWCEEYYRETRQVSGVLVGPLYEQ